MANINFMCFLDSLDEALMNQQTIAGLLADGIGQLPSVGRPLASHCCRQPTGLQNWSKP